MSEVLTLIKNLPSTKVGSINVSLVEYEEAARNLQAQAERAVVSDEKSFAKGGDLVKIIRNQAKMAEDNREELVGPYNKLLKFVNAAFKPVAAEFDKARGTIEKKMLVWRREEDKRIRAEAEKERLRLEEEALERAAQEKSSQAQNEVLDAAADAGKELVDSAMVGIKRGMYGSTGSRKVYSTRVDNTIEFLGALAAHIVDGNKRNIQIDSLIEFRKAGMNKLAQDMLAQGVKKMPGAEFIEDDSIRVY